MKPIKLRWLLLAVAISFVAVGIPYWSIPYNKLNLPDALLGPGLLVVVISALLLRFGGVISFWRSTWPVGASVAAVVIARVLVDGARDSTSHNLWPLEVVIALIVGFVCAATGAMVGSLLAKLLPRRPSDSEP